MGLRIFWGLSGFICRSQFFCRRQKVHTWGLCLPKSSDLHFKRDVSHFFQGDVISSGQLAQSTRGPRAGVCRETNDLGPAAIMLRGYFGHWRMPRTFQFPSRMGERVLLKHSHHQLKPDPFFVSSVLGGGTDLETRSLKTLV